MADLDDSEAIIGEGERDQFLEESSNAVDKEDDDHQHEPKYKIKWLRYILVLGNPPALTHRQWMVFSLLSLAGFFSVYDDVLRAVCIDDIQRSLDISESDLPWVVTVIRCGAIPSFVLTLMADVMGRKPLLLLTISMYTLMTALTAVSFNVYWFVITQFFGKLFLMAEFLISNVAIIEEFDAGTRGWAMGGMGAMATAGGGFALCLYAAASGSTYGWRILFMLGVIPLAALTYFRRQLPETRSFDERDNRDESEMADAEGCERCSVAMTQLWIPISKLFEEASGLALLFGSMLFIYGLASHPAAFYQFKFLEEERGYDALDIFLLGVFGGLIAVALYASLGSWSDKYGRKPFFISAFMVFFTTGLLVFNVNIEALIPIFWILFAGCGFGLEILSMTIISESFKTESRATAQGFTTVCYVVGTILGLLIEGVLYQRTGEHSQSLSWLLIIGFICPVLALFVPETFREHLE
eukprot:CAMPEP_0197539742 /NCGR_PEP_ID=MMETSP1318-20131121/63666_1 /TAXON_ID=552666 /ORGANISM="Partenskyella glossopodia, Strain RCC365" /LENGTH=468 /DNA_ID=CAMNT_0043098531 /DNA_START=78 /DNA_END=1484 /DNA_ORIENTATION=-